MERAADGEGYDIIGDVHGCAGQLVQLLHSLGYHRSSAADPFQHRCRTVVFVGDLIDRGPGQVEVLQVVRAMVHAGTAQVVMGNHEFNAVAFATPDPDHPGEHLRRHSDKNNRQHQAFLEQIGAWSADHLATIDWFRTLPLWLELDGVRVVHASWDPAAMRGLDGARLDPGQFVAASREGSDAYRWVENLCKGPEVELCDGLSFVDKDGHVRHHARYRWWDPRSGTYLTALENPSDTPFPDKVIPDLPVPRYVDDTPVLFGHYWRTWPEIDLNDRAACIDYSAVKGGPLVAYRWSGEATLVATNLVPCR